MPIGKATAEVTVSASTVPTSSASAAPTSSASAKPASVLPELPYLPAQVTPEDNPLTTEKIELGKLLFFDQRLGKDGKFACESCHYIDKGWADGKSFSTKADGKDNGRHTPSLYNVGFQKEWYWDGRKDTIEGQILAAWKGQMGAGDKLDERVAELGKVETYKKMFKAAFGSDEMTPDQVVQALACFIRTIRSGNSPWDKKEKGDTKAVSEAALRGYEVFTAKANCSACHAPPLYTDNLFHNVGIGYDKPEPDLGRFNVTKKDKDKGRFKTPTLRSIATHAPYFHDGSAKTIEEAVDYMLGGGHANDNLDDGLKKVVLTKEQRSDLLAFLESLTAPETFERPTVPE